MATAADMAAYTAILSQYKPAQDKPVTEIAILKLNPSAPQTASTLSYFEQEIIAKTSPGTGIRRQAYGFSLTDPNTFIWMLDWDKIQDHWDFWQTPAFAPVIACITKLFVAGRPLVRHYEFTPEGMLSQELQRVVVWDDGKENVGSSVVKGEDVAIAKKDAYAVDMQETTWRCVVLGYESGSDARGAGDEKIEGVESHLVKLKFVEKPN